MLVVRGAPDQHLSLFRGEVVFDCVELYAHFRQSYEDHARPYILDHIGDAQRRLDVLLRHDEVKARSLIAKLPPDRFPQTPSHGSVESASASGGLVPLATPIKVRPADAVDTLVPIEIEEPEPRTFRCAWTNAPIRPSLRPDGSGGDHRRGVGADRRPRRGHAGGDLLRVLAQR